MLGKRAVVEGQCESYDLKNNNQISADEVTKIASIVKETIDGSSPTEDIQIKEEIRYLLSFVDQAKEEISSLRPKEYSTNKLPAACGELDAIVSGTEEAAGKVMDCADELSEVSEKCNDEVKQQLGDISVKLFEASSFQDITGQRVTKVVTTLVHLEERLSALADAMGDNDVDEVVSDDDNVDKDYDAMANEEFTHGPQLDGEAKDQAAIDALLDDF